MAKTIIAGPCSVESYEQLAAVTEELARMPEVAMIRAGVWKPRTRPGGFEGLGEQALQWMQELQKEYSKPFCCEVARPEHVELCLRYGINTIWIGARTTANPFMVEELCEALTGSGINVLVKNPVCPDVRLWLGAIERLQKTGIGSITAVHRGFSMYNNQGYRNAPLWEIPLQLRREMPEINILCDPSHIGGSRELIEPIVMAAQQLDYDGLMVEVHPHPDDAWTDGSQQLSSDEFNTLLDKYLNTPAPASDSLTQRLTPLRQQIDDIDHNLITLLARRMALSSQIADIKRELHSPVYQSSRWADVLADRLQLASDLGLDADFTREMLEKIHGESVRVQLG